uniref:MobA-like NTP transferase domain-containing protein n=1 Tax=mine drainage metagenome TaxID=410659 RepID=E6QMK2_9ZZZZ
MPAEGFVLAGGHSSRMGRDKALIHFGNASLISIAIDTFQRVGLPARIAGSRSDLDAFAEIIPDTFVNVGPLGGVHAALATSKAEWSVFIPVDMPLLPASLLRCLLDRAAITRAAITCLRCNGFLHPFPVILHRSLLDFIEHFGALKIGDTASVGFATTGDTTSRDLTHWLRASTHQLSSRSCKLVNSSPAHCRRRCGFKAQTHRTRCASS